MVIYTSYFGRLRHISGGFPIAVCRYPPKYFKGGHIIELAPTERSLRYYKNSGDCSFIEFTERYCIEVLSHLDTLEVYETIKAIAGSNIPVLCCYEKDYTQCHRSIIGSWLRLAGFNVIEV